MYLVTQEPEDHHSRQVPLQALGFLCWGPACLAEKVSKPFASLQWGICVNVNLYLTNRILSPRMYKYLIIYYKCFHQVINEGPWQKAKGLWGEQDATGEAGGGRASRCARFLGWWVGWCGGCPPGTGAGTSSRTCPTATDRPEDQKPAWNLATRRAAMPLSRLAFAESKAFYMRKLQNRTLLVVDFIYVWILVAIWSPA